MWYEIAPALAAGYRVHGWDMPGSSRCIPRSACPSPCAGAPRTPGFPSQG
ncbi:hypothetical protein ABZ499_19675 [Streptomyces sp. NPDC019990]